MEFVGKPIFSGPNLMEFVGKAISPTLMEFVGKPIVSISTNLNGIRRQGHFGPT